MTITTTGDATSNPMIVGAAGLGTLTIAGGPVELRTDVLVGSDVAGDGTLMIESAARLEVRHLVAGRFGTADVLITGGSALAVAALIGEDTSAEFGAETGARATVTVSGASTSLHVNSTGEYHFVSELYAGYVTGGTATLSLGKGGGNIMVGDGALVDISASTPVDSYGHYEGVANLQIALDGPGGVASGASRFSIASGGRVVLASDHRTAVTVGSQGTLSVDGVNSNLEIGNGSFAHNRLDVFGALTISDGGAVNMTAYANNSNRLNVRGSAGLISVDGAGSTLSLRAAEGATSISSLLVGYDAGNTGTLRVTNGARVLNDPASSISVATIGNSLAFGSTPASRGSVNVDGNGNADTLFDAGALLVVGAHWSGPGATLDSVGFASGGSGSVSSLDSAIVRADRIAVGSGGAIRGNSAFDGSVTVDAGGRIAPSGTLTITGGLDMIDGTMRFLVGGAAPNVIRVNGATTLGDADINISVRPGINFVDGSRLLLVDGGTGLAATNIGLIDTVISGEPAALAYQVADEGADLVFEALNNGAGAALVSFGALSTNAATAVFAGSTGTASGGRFDAVRYVRSTGFEGTAAGDTFTVAAAGGATLKGLGGGDRLTGGGGRDTLEGGAGADLIRGFGNDDTINGGAAGDNLDGGDGIDTLSYAGSTAGVNINLLFTIARGGDAQGDTIRGFENIIGGNGNDTLVGNLGANRLTGGLGSDVLSGGLGADIFDFNSIAESNVAIAGRDTISGFNGANADRIDLSTIDAIFGGADNMFTFIGGANFTGLGQVRTFVFNGTTFIDINTIGNALPDMRIALTGLMVLDAADFIL